jgi:predicted nuclease with TOPRIM domain
MPAKRKNTRQKASPDQPRAIGRTGNKKQIEPSFKLVLKRLDKFDQRFDALDRKIETVDQKVDAARQETAAEFKAVRGEMAQGLAAVRGEMAQGLAAVRGEMAQGLAAVRGEMAQGLAAVRGEMAQGFAAVRGEMAQGFDSLRHEFKAELQKEFEKHGAGIHQHISRVENELKAENAELRGEHRQLLTGMDNAAKNYEQFSDDRKIMDAEIHDLQRNVETLKKRDMEKAAAIDKIEKEIDKLKTA